MVVRAIVRACVAGLIVAPTVLVIIEVLLGDVHLGEAAVGALIGTGFFLITAVTAVIFQDGPELRTAVMLGYVVKTSVLLGLAMSVSLDGVDRTTLGISTAGSALAYLVVQTASIARRRPLPASRRRPTFLRRRQTGKARAAQSTMPAGPLAAADGSGIRPG